MQDCIIFGTYKLNDKDKISGILKYINSKGIKEIDTAQLYKNESIINNIITEIGIDGKLMDFKVNTKISKYTNLGYVSKRITYAKDLFGENLKSLMLHHPAELCLNRLLQSKCDEQNINFGVSNITLKQLQFFHINKIFPKFIQIEFHPFVPVIDLVNYCTLHDIKIQGYSILANCKYLSFVPLVNMAAKYTDLYKSNISVAKIMIRWAYQHNIQLCLTSLNKDHIDEWLTTNDFEISIDDMAEINAYNVTHPHRFYNKIPNQLVNLNLPSDVPEYFKEVANVLKADIIKMEKGESISDMVIHLQKITLNLLNEDPFYDPITNSVICCSNEPFNEVKQNLEQLDEVEQDQKARNLKFFNILKKLRKLHGVQCIGKKKDFAKVRNSCMLKSSHHILHPEAMPVEITDEIMFKPFFDYLESPEIPSEIKTFIKGTFYPDQRMDLCKQVVGYKSIQELCRVVKRSNKVKHFLLGNNIALDQNEVDGASAIADLIKNSTIETWYLAGNAISAIGLKIICEALFNNQHAKALWLKRNPVHTGTHQIKKMLNNNTTLELIDLNNCGVGNNGLVQLFTNNTNSTLKHIYLDTNDISKLEPFTEYIRHHKQLETIYISMNPLNTELDSLSEFLLELNKCDKLERLCLSSSGLDDSFNFDTINIPSLRMLDLGMYKSTNDLGLSSNNFTNMSTDPIIRFISRHEKLEYISFYGSPINDECIFECQESNPHLSIQLTHRTEYVRFLSESNFMDYLNREVKHPRMVENIDSIYRGK